VTQQPTDSSATLSVLRIYLRRRGTKPGRGFWGRLFGRSLSYDLAERALEAGVTYATVTLGHAGSCRAQGASSPTSPRCLRHAASCVELVAPADVLEALVAANRDELADAVLLRLDGARVTLRGASA